MFNSADLQRHIGKFYGKYSGEVIDNADESHQGLIRVRVDTIFGSGADSVFTARPCLPYGHFYVPHNGAKVWVEFEAGDLGYPIWSGTWYPQGTTVAQAAVSPPVNRVIHTPSGHRIEFDDTEGEEKIMIRHKSNAFISIDKDGSVLISNKNGSHLFLNAADARVTLVEEHGNTVLMQSDGMLLANHAGTAVELKDDGVRVVAAGTVQVSAKDVLLDSGSVVLGKGAQFAAIVGDIFATLFDTHTHPTAMGPSGPPVLPISGGPALSKQVKVI